MLLLRSSDSAIFLVSFSILCLTSFSHFLQLLVILLLKRNVCCNLCLTFRTGLLTCPQKQIFGGTYFVYVFFEFILEVVMNFPKLYVPYHIVNVTFEMLKLGSEGVIYCFSNRSLCSCRCCES